jgi:hypothetical protein
MHFAAGQVALLVTESLLLTLIDTGVLSREEVLDVVETAQQTSRKW